MSSKSEMGAMSDKQGGGRGGAGGVRSGRLTACTGRIQDGDCDVSISVLDRAGSIYHVYLFDMIQSHGSVGPGGSVQ